MNVLPSDAHVLFVDDDEPMRNLARATIERGHPELSVTTCPGPEDALELLESTPVDCVVTDYKMPGMDGMAFLEAIRALDDDLPVVFFTGQGSEEIASEAISAGVTDYIRKEPGLKVFHVLGSRVLSLVRMQRAEREAALADRRLREMFDRVSDAVVSLDEDRTVTYLNEGAESIFGPSEEVLGERLTTVIPSLADSAFERLVEEAMATQQTSSLEADLSVGDRIVSVTAYPAADGISVFVQDLTTLKAQEREIEKLQLELDDTQTKFRTLTQKVSKPNARFR